MDGHFPSVAIQKQKGGGLTSSKAFVDDYHRLCLVIYAAKWVGQLAT